MDRYTQWVIDATFDTGPNRPLTFCPLDGDDIITGLNFLGLPPIGTEIVGVVHADGDEAVNAWCDCNQDRIRRVIAEQAAHNEAYKGLTQ